MTALKTNNFTNVIAAFLTFLLTFTLPCYADTADDSIIEDTISVINGYGYGALAVGTLWIAGTVFSKSLKSSNQTSTGTGDTDVTLNQITFEQPGIQTLVITATGKQPITVKDVSIQGAHNITITNSDYNNCQAMNFNESCEVKLTASPNAYGNGEIIVSYVNDTIFSNIKQIATNITVRDTALKLTGAQNNTITSGSNIIVAENKSPQTFTLLNNGHFYWQSADLKWQKKPTGVAIAADNCSSKNIAPNASCTFQLDTTAGNPGNNGILNITGNNITSLQNNVIIDGNLLAITVNTEPNDLHLGYRSVKITNVSASNATITSIATQFTDNSQNTAPNILQNEITYCAANDNNCYYKSTCGNTLEAQKSCLLWFKALDNPTADLTTSSGSISATIGWTITNDGITFDGPSTANFNITYEQALYAGGNFTTTAGNNPANYIAKWNGSTWNRLLGAGTSDGVAGNVNAIHHMNGDLYIGGNFGSAGGNAVNNIAKWNGSTWSGLSNDNNSIGVNGQVYAISNISNNLYVGGAFTLAGNNLANNIAMWNGATWSALGTNTNGVNNTVYAMNSFNNELYAGGAFTSAGGNPASKIAKWDGSLWSALGSGMDDIVYAITNFDDALHASGNIVSDPPTGLFPISKWTGANWINLGDSHSGLHNTVYALDTFNGKLYAGGDRSLYGASTAQIYCWDYSVSLSWHWSDALGDKITCSSGDGCSIAAITNFNKVLYVGGSFISSLGESTANNVAKYSCQSDNTCAWTPIGLGIDNKVSALTVAPALTINTQIN